MTIVRHIDLKGLGYCNPGARAWFRRKGLDWHGLVFDGVSAEALRAVAPDDQLVERAIEAARIRESNT